MSLASNFIFSRKRFCDVIQLLIPQLQQIFIINPNTWYDLNPNSVYSYWNVLLYEIDLCCTFGSLAIILFFYGCLSIISQEVNFFLLSSQFSSVVAKLCFSTATIFPIPRPPSPPSYFEKKSGMSPPCAPQKHYTFATGVFFLHQIHCAHPHCAAWTRGDDVYSQV